MTFVNINMAYTDMRNVPAHQVIVIKRKGTTQRPQRCVPSPMHGNGDHFFQVHAYGNP